jgi:hypothetical protein
MADRYPELITHCTNSSLSVYDTISRGLQSVLVPRLSVIANVQLHSVQQLLNQTVLFNEPDKRQSPFLKPDQSLDTAALYRMIKAKGQTPRQCSSRKAWHPQSQNVHVGPNEKEKSNAGKSFSRKELLILQFARSAALMSSLQNTSSMAAQLGRRYGLGCVYSPC